MDNFETLLSKAISICDGYFIHLKEYSKVYTFTTENINGYIKYFDLENKSLLTVGSSGDQILNAFFYGARDITLYDINPYAKHYIYLKIAAISSLDYKEFQEFFFKHGIDEYYNKKMFSKDIFNKIKPNLRLFDYESYLYFDEIFTAFDPDIIRGYLFNDDENRNKVIKNFNVYLNSEDSYNELKSIIRKINFKYIYGDVFKDDIPGQFDNIFLSNLCSITTLDKFKELLQKIDANNLKENGSVMFAYLWNTSLNSKDYKEDWKDIYKLPLTQETLSEFISEYHNIKGSRDILWQENEKEDLVLIYRKNNT